MSERWQSLQAMMHEQRTVLAAVLQHYPAAGTAVCLVLCCVVGSTSTAWAQQIDIPPLSEWLDTVSWYSFIPILRIAGGLLLVGGLASSMTTRVGNSGAGVVAMIVGGILLLVPEIVNAIYARTNVGTNWATSPAGP